MDKLRVIRLGRMDYKEALALQEELLALRQLDACEDTLLLLEHPPVLTMGIRTRQEHILADRQLLMEQGVEVVACNRGGDVTYHGPGQLVGYPIFKLEGRNRSIKDFVGRIEEVFLSILQEDYSIEGSLGAGRETGVFVGEDKICAIGIAVKQHVTMHGFAFNANTNLDHFKWIVPCGLKDKGVTSLERLTGRRIDMEQLMDQVTARFEHLFEKEAWTVYNIDRREGWT